jgi:hypothetical protein
MSPPNANEELAHPGSGEKDVAEMAITDVDVKPAQARDDVYDHAERIAYAPEEGARVLRKIDLILLPLLCGCYIFSVGHVAGLPIHTASTRTGTRTST